MPAARNSVSQSQCEYLIVLANGQRLYPRQAANTSQRTWQHYLTRSASNRTPESNISPRRTRILLIRRCIFRDICVCDTNRNIISVVCVLLWYFCGFCDIFTGLWNDVTILYKFQFIVGELSTVWSKCSIGCCHRLFP